MSIIVEYILFKDNTLQHTAYLNNISTNVDTCSQDPFHFSGTIYEKNTLIDLISASNININISQIKLFIVIYYFNCNISQNI